MSNTRDPFYNPHETNETLIARHDRGQYVLNELVHYRTYHARVVSIAHSPHAPRAKDRLSYEIRYWDSDPAVPGSYHAHVMPHEIAPRFGAV